MRRGPEPGSEWSLEQTLARPVGLREHLSEQISVDVADPADRLIALQLIDLLDDSGYLPADLDFLAERFSCPVERIDAVVRRLHGMDPLGVFARSLSECLAIQLREKDRLDPAMQAMLDNLELLAKRDKTGLCRVCGVDAEDLADMVAEIQELNPRPAAVFQEEPVQPLVPDILMRRLPNGSWVVELNSETLPRVLVNNAYYATVSRQVRQKQEKEYLSERFSAANWLVKALHQRATTILKVATELVRQQAGFFEHGVSHLRPLILRDIAEAIDMHESTVSRVTTNKFIATPRGIYELKFFFSAAIPATGGGAPLSAESVRHRIRHLIDDEPVDAVLSDDSIVEILRSDGIDIARRTVAKYRESLKIPSSVQRRREKATMF